jgi:hypothetical protein
MLSSRTKTLLCRIFAFLAVMLIGAFLFWATEGKRKISEPTEVDFQTMYNMSKQDYNLLLESVRNDTSSPTVDRLPWTFGNSFYFVLVLITTIGKHPCVVCRPGNLFEVPRILKISFWNVLSKLSKIRVCNSEVNLTVFMLYVFVYTNMNMFKHECSMIP